MFNRKSEPTTELSGAQNYAPEPPPGFVPLSGQAKADILAALGRIYYRDGVPERDCAVEFTARGKLPPLDEFREVPAGCLISLELPGFMPPPGFRRQTPRQRWDREDSPHRWDPFDLAAYIPPAVTVQLDDWWVESRSGRCWKAGTAWPKDALPPDENAGVPLSRQARRKIVRAAMDRRPVEPTVHTEDHVRWRAQMASVPSWVYTPAEGACLGTPDQDTDLSRVVVVDGRLDEDQVEDLLEQVRVCPDGRIVYRTGVSA